jgi:carboxymethylenebutenolidase
VVDLSERVRADDGEFGAMTRLPPSGSGPGIVLVQEIFGVNAYLESVADRLAVLGYTVVAPDLYWRIEPGIALTHSDEDLARGMELGQQLDGELAVGDLAATLAHARQMDEVEGGVGVLGFCMGGTLAYHLAAGFDPDVCVSYYGSGVPDALGRMGEIDRPTIFHFGGDDPYIERAGVDAVGRAAADSDVADFHVWEGAGHAFDNLKSERFHQPEPAIAAWGVTATFLAHHFPADSAAAALPLGEA